MGWGTGSWGTSPWGIAGPSFGVASARQVADNAVEITFSDPPFAFDPATFWDALNPANWTTAGVSPFGLVSRLVRSVVSVDAFTVRVLLDGPLSGPGDIYEVTTAPEVESASGTVIDPSLRSAQFTTFSIPRVTALQARGAPVLPADISNPQVQSDAPSQTAPLGTYQVTDRGDYALERGTPYLRKRVLRRATTVINGFLFLPGYGFLEGIKTLARADTIRRMRSRAIAQISQEPDIASVNVIMRQQRVGDTMVVFMDIKGTDTSGQPFGMSVPVTPAAG
jgi:hypothetical protein